jgi:transcription termination factor Rho
MNFEDEKTISNRIKILIKNMFSNREDGWAKSAEMNKGGPKTKIEIQKEVEKKYKDEQAARDRNQGGGGRYGDRKDGYNNRDNRDNRDRRDGGNRNNNDGYNNNDGGRRNTENRYQKKDTQGGTYGKGGRENRNERDNRDNRDRKPTVRDAPKIIELDDEEMAAQLKKNFEEYAAQGVEENDEEVEDAKPEDKKFDLSSYDKLKSENGKTGPTIFFNLLCKVFDEEMQKVDLHFEGYMG